MENPTKIKSKFQLTFTLTFKDDTPISIAFNEQKPNQICEIFRSDK